MSATVRITEVTLKKSENSNSMSVVDWYNGLKSIAVKTSQVDPMQTFEKINGMIPGAK
jgi:hypothetical protein